jgi:hypothetical protein
MKILAFVMMLTAGFCLAGCSAAEEQTAAGENNTPPSLETWVGNYTFSERGATDQSRGYFISISEESGSYYAELLLYSTEGMEKLRASVTGDEDEVSLLFDSDLSDDPAVAYEPGDELVRFERNGEELYTYWGKIQPLLEENKSSGEAYFKLDPVEYPDAMENGTCCLLY